MWFPQANLMLLLSRLSQMVRCQDLCLKLFLVFSIDRNVCLMMLADTALKIINSLGVCVCERT